MKIKKSWSEFKTLIVSKMLTYQYDEPLTKDYYVIFAIDHSVCYSCELEKGSTNAIDFENNYKSKANREIKETVTTQREKDDKSLKIIKMSGICNANSVKDLFIKIPGSLNYDFVKGKFNEDLTNDRVVAGGKLKSLNAEKDDFITLEIVDHIGLLGGGPDYIVGTHTETNEIYGDHATIAVQSLTYVAVENGTSGNYLTVKYVSGGTAGSEFVTITGNDISVQIEGGISTALQIYNAIMSNANTLPKIRCYFSGPPTNTQSVATSINLTGGTEGSSDNKKGWYLLDEETSNSRSVLIKSDSPAYIYAGLYLKISYNASSAGTTREIYCNIEWEQRNQ